jgi:hypothetical protein
MELYQIKIFTAKDIISRLKGQLTEWEKSFANFIFDKGLITKIYEELKKLYFQRINNLIN